MLQPSICKRAQRELAPLLHCGSFKSKFNHTESLCNNVKNIYAEHAQGQVQLQSPTCCETDGWPLDRLTIAARDECGQIDRSRVRELINRTSAINKGQRESGEEPG